MGRRAVASAEHAHTDAPPVRAPTADSPSRPRHGLVTVQRQRHRRTLAADTVSVIRLRLLTAGLTASALLTLTACDDDGSGSASATSSAPVAPAPATTSAAPASIRPCAGSALVTSTQVTNRRRQPGRDGHPG